MTRRGRPEPITLYKLEEGRPVPATLRDITQALMQEYEGCYTSTMPYKNPEDKAAWYEKNRARLSEKARARYQENIEQRREYARNRQRERRQFVTEFKEQHPCACCGGRFPGIVMEFHHPRGRDKEGAVSDMIREGVNLERIKAEMEKCELLCANCHRLAHWREGQGEAGSEILTEGGSTGAGSKIPTGGGSSCAGAAFSRTTV